jgi:rod shape determining protein RodA
VLVDKRLTRNIDIWLIVVVLLITAIGLLVLYSATQPEVFPLTRVKKQATFIALGSVIVLLIVSIDYRAFERLYYPMYFGCILLLGLVLMWGNVEYGAQRWFRIGGFSLQPSEIAKVFIILTLAYSMSLREGNHSFWDVCAYLAHVAVPMVLILKQPDLGTSLVLLAILFGMMFVAGVPNKYLFMLAAAGLAASPIVYTKFLEDYQKRRLLAFIDPSLDRFGTGYNIIQSKVAIGSGGLFGKGYLAGTQTQLSFLPARYSDFIFSVLCEEFGFIGGCLLVLLFAVLLWRGMRIALTAKDEYGRLIAAGVVSYLFFHVLTNIGMSLAILPVTGIPLPFVSYGGSSLLTSMAGVGLLLNVYMRRHKLTFK